MAKDAVAALVLIDGFKEPPSTLQRVRVAPEHCRDEQRPDAGEEVVFVIFGRVHGSCLLRSFTPGSSPLVKVTPAEITGGQYMRPGAVNRPVSVRWSDKRGCCRQSPA